MSSPPPDHGAQGPPASTSALGGAAPTLVIDAAPAGGCSVVLHLAGELDLATAGQLHACVAQELATGRRQVQLHLAAVSFCDVRGWQALATASRQVRRAGGQLSVHGPYCPSLRCLLAVLGPIDDITLLEP